MNTATIVGLVLIFVGVMDVVLGFVLVAPRLPEEARPRLKLAISFSACAMIGLGAAFLLGLLKV